MKIHTQEINGKDKQQTMTFKYKIFINLIKIYNSYFSIEINL